MFLDHYPDMSNMWPTKAADSLEGRDVKDWFKNEKGEEVQGESVQIEGVWKEDGRVITINKEAGLANVGRWEKGVQEGPENGEHFFFLFFF